MPRDPAVVLTVANVPECDVILAREVTGTPLELGELTQIQAENIDGYAWLWGDIEVNAAVLDGRNPGEVHAFLARKVEGIAEQWLDITDDGALIVCARAWLDSPDHFDRLTIPEAIARLNTTRTVVLEALNTPTAHALPRG